MKILKSIVVLFLLGFALSSAAVAAEGAQPSQTGGAWFWLIAPIFSLVALGFAYYFYKKMMEAPEGTEKMIEIARHVREGAYAYLFRQYCVVTLVFIILLAILGFCAYKGVQNPFVPVAFLTGGFFSGLCGFLGMKTATNASARTAQGASKSLNSGLQVAFRSGSVMGLVVVGGQPSKNWIWQRSTQGKSLKMRKGDLVEIREDRFKDLGSHSGFTLYQDVKKDGVYLLVIPQSDGTPGKIMIPLLAQATEAEPKAS